MVNLFYIYTIFSGEGGHAYLKEWMWWAGLISSEIDFLFSTRFIMLPTSHTQAFEHILIYHHGDIKSRPTDLIYHVH